MISEINAIKSDIEKFDPYKKGLKNDLKNDLTEAEHLYGGICFR